MNRDPVLKVILRDSGGAAGDASTEYPPGLFDHNGRHRFTDGGPNLRCKRKSAFGVAQLRLTPIVGVANIDGIRIQFDQLFEPHWERLFQGVERRERSQIVGSGCLNAQVRKQAFQILFGGLLAMKTDRVERATFLDRNKSGLPLPCRAPPCEPTDGLPQPPQAARSYRIRPSREAGQYTVFTTFRYLSKRELVETTMSIGPGKSGSEIYSSAARFLGSATSENNTSRSMSLPGPASPRAREPKRMILSGENRSAICRARSSSAAGLSAIPLMAFMITRLHAADRVV
jgi:hypothetical protein